MKYFIVFTFLLTFISCKQATTTATTITPISSGKCIIGKWSDSQLPLQVKMSPDFTSDYSGVDIVNGLNPLEQMASVWNAATPTKTLITTPFLATTASGLTTTSSFRDDEIGIYKSYNWFSNVSSEALAITQFYGVVTSSNVLGQYINLTHADIIVNYRDYGSRMTMTDNPMFEYDVPTIVLHEMGHLLGLCHETTKPSIMMPRYVTTQHSLQNFDKTIIKNLYVDNSSISALSAIKSTNSEGRTINTNGLDYPEGTEIKGVIELHANGNCVHYVNGKKIFEHSTTNAFRK